MLALDVVCVAVAFWLSWRERRERQRSDSMLAQARAEIGRLEEHVDYERRRLAACGVAANANTRESFDAFDCGECDSGSLLDVRRAVLREIELRENHENLKQFSDTLRMMANSLAKDFNDATKQVSELQKQIETLRAIIDLRDKTICDVRATLDKRDAELKNMSESMRNERIRAEAKTEGLEKQLQQEQQTTKGLRNRLAEAERKLELAQGSIEGQRRENQSAIRHHAECVRQRDQLATELDAAKTLLAGVKIGVGELLIVQPDGECTEEALDALRSQMGPIDGKVVVVRHVNAWRAVPIPRATATKVDEVAQDLLGDVLAGKPPEVVVPISDEAEELRRLWEGHKLAGPGRAALDAARYFRDQAARVPQLEEHLNGLKVQLDECRSKREAITFERDAYARDFAKLQLDHANTVALLESVQRELGDFQTLFDVLTCFEVNGSCSGMQSTGEWNQINIGLSSRLIHPSRTGDGRSAPAATVANRDTSKGGPTSEQLQALADLLLAGCQRKYPLLATWGAKESTAGGV